MIKGISSRVAGVDCGISNNLVLIFGGKEPPLNRGNMGENKLELEKLNTLYAEIRAVLEKARSSAYRAVNFAMVQAYWQIGYLIVEHEQEGKERAEYGKAVLEEISRRLTGEFGKGFDVTNLRKMRQFYLMFSKRDAVNLKSDPIKRDAMRLESEDAMKVSAVRSELSWTHYRHLLRVENDRAREWYMNEAADQNWSTRQLDRQISTLYYERLLASPDKEPVKQEAAEKLMQIKPEDFIRDPYVLEFLNLKDYPGLRESTVEQAIIDRLQEFLLDLGKGPALVQLPPFNHASCIQRVRRQGRPTSAGARLQD